MTNPISDEQLIAYSQELVDRVFPQVPQEEFFIAGGAFKPLLRENLEVRDIDLWVRDRKARERLREELLGLGATLIRDFEPYCIALEINGFPLEITYQNAYDEFPSRVLEHFDLTVSSIGISCKEGRVREAFITPEAEFSLRERKLFLCKAWLADMLEKHGFILGSIQRLRSFSAQLGWPIAEGEIEKLWDAYESFPLDARCENLKRFVEIDVKYKGAEVMDTLVTAIERL
jgi:hypothetical protein